ncbi:MAG: hypothetical protein ACRC2T_00365 [Thermoguttaceae bacterium]
MTNIIEVYRMWNPVLSQQCVINLGWAVTNGTATEEDYPYRIKIWDLRPFKEPGIGVPGMIWRLRDYTGLLYGNGTIDETGTLVGLQDEFKTSYNYDGFMVLQMACPTTPDQKNDIWPPRPDFDNPKLIPDKKDEQQQ